MSIYFWIILGTIGMAMLSLGMKAARADAARQQKLADDTAQKIVDGLKDRPAA